MAAPTETAGTGPTRKSRAEARRAERSPSGGWRTIAGKELADHIASWRFFILLAIIAALAMLPVVFTSSDLSSAASQLSNVSAQVGSSPVFLAMFTLGSNTLGNMAMVNFVALLLPLVGIAFGFDGVNSERSQGTLSRLLAQPVHRDDVVNGKFAAGIAVIAVMVVTLVLLVTGLGMLRLGIIPSAEAVARIAIWIIATVLYASFWLAFALLISVVVRSTATAALIGFGVWLATTIVGSLLLPVLANALFPVTADSAMGNQLFLRLSPSQLYMDVVQVVLNPAAKAAFIANVGQLNSAQSQLPGLLSLDQSVLLVWPQLVALTALTVLLFAISYVLFLRQEVRA